MVWEPYGVHCCWWCNFYHILLLEYWTNATSYWFGKFFEIWSLGFPRNSIVILVWVIRNLVPVYLNWALISIIPIICCFIFSVRSLQKLSARFDATVELSIVVIDRQRSLIISLILKVDGSNVFNLHTTRSWTVSYTRICCSSFVYLYVYSISKILLVLCFDGLCFYPLYVHIYII